MLAVVGLYLWSGAKQELERSRVQAAAQESRRVNNDSEIRQKDGESRQLKEEIQQLKIELKAQKKKNFDSKQARPAADATEELQQAQLRSDLATWKAAAEQARLDAENAKQQAQKLSEALRQQANRDKREDSRPAPEQVVAPVAAPAVSDERLAALKHEIDGLRTQLAAEKQRIGAEAKVVTDMRRKVEWHRRIHLVQRGEMEKMEDKMAHVRARYLELCGDYVRLTKAVPNPERLQSQVLSPEGQKELAAMQAEQTEYQQAQEKAPVEAPPTPSNH